jgi:Bacterial regulatory proteins, lacI family
MRDPGFGPESHPERGLTKPMAATTRIYDVAAAAHVSLGTVSNVLNRPDLVSANTRERVTP